MRRIWISSCGGESHWRLGTRRSYRRLVTLVSRRCPSRTGEATVKLIGTWSAARERLTVCYSRAMSTSVAVSPFVPGYGGLPPYLAGRHREQNELRRLLAYLESGRGAPRSAVLTGPRGNGKTALLRWFQRDIESGENDIDVIWLWSESSRRASATPTSCNCGEMRCGTLRTTLVPPALTTP